MQPSPPQLYNDNGNRHGMKQDSDPASVTSKPAVRQHYPLDMKTMKGNVSNASHPIPTTTSGSSNSWNDSMQLLALEKHIFRKDETPVYTQLDILVPLAGGDNQLLVFAKSLGETLRKNRLVGSNSFTFVRLLVTRYKNDDITPVFKKALEDFGVPAVLFVTMPPTATFHRAAALNALHRSACFRLRCLASSMDVDMKVGVASFDRVHRIVIPGMVAHFPIVWSEINPETVEEVEKYLNVALETFSPHRGCWRQFGFGMYAIAGPDINYLRLNESFIGWGGEDNDFFQMVAKQMKVRRANETGLIHTWHNKDCGGGNFVQIFQPRCLESKWAFEGSMLGQSLMLSHKKFLDKPRRLKSLFIIHVGPATSESQRMHRQLTDLMPYLKIDNTPITESGGKRTRFSYHRVLCLHLSRKVVGRGQDSAITASYVPA